MPAPSSSLELLFRGGGGVGSSTTMDNDEQEEAPGRLALHPPWPAVPLVRGKEAVQTLLGGSALCLVDCQTSREGSKGAEGLWTEAESQAVSLRL